MNRVLIFDFGGVLMKTRDYAPRLAWDNRLGLATGTVERTVHNATSWVQAQTGQISLKDYWDDVRKQLNINADDVQQLADDFYSGDMLDPLLVSYIRQQKDAGITVALLSNDTHELLRPKLKEHEIIDLFEPLVISSEIGVMKPNSEAYTAVLDQLERPAEETIFIDDRPENIAGAETVGILGVHYVDGMNLAEILQPLLTT